MKTLIFLLLITCILSSCKSTPSKIASANAPQSAEIKIRTPAAVPPPPLPEVDEAALDRSIKPCEDFYQFACGGWIEKTEAPKDRPFWSRGFVEIIERNLITLRKILNDYKDGKNTPPNKYSKKLGDFYDSCIDEESADKLALSALKSELKPIDDLQATSELHHLLASLHKKGIGAFFTVGPEVDFKNPKLMIFAVDQGGLGLPDRDYYIKDDKNMTQLKQAYQRHISKMLVLSGLNIKDADEQAQSILNLETKMAQAQMPRVDRRQPENVYHRIEKQGLKEKAPRFNWDVYLTELGYPKITQIDVNDPDYIEKLDHLLTEESLNGIKAYLRYHLIAALAPALSKEFIDEDFDFNGKTLSGQEELAPRWKRCIGATDGFLGFAIGKAFVDKTFGQEGKQRSKAMIEQIEAAFKKNLKSLAWMDEKTKFIAFQKLRSLVNSIGYPDKMRNYKSMVVNRGTYLRNYLEGIRYMVQYNLDKIGRPVDRKEWGMTPPTVNAYYDTQFNKMVFPAGILQPPFYYRNGEASLNFGAIGLVMGHELTHGYDDQGRKYAPNGALENWWTKTSEDEFKNRIQCVENQYDKYIVQNTLHVNGKLTLGENIADQGGAKLAYEAWSASNKESRSTISNQSIETEMAPKTFTPPQKFFLGFAQSWCSKVKPELERMKLVVDVHSPPRYRVNGTVSSSPAFQEAFHCKVGAPMAPENRCRVW